MTAHTLDGSFLSQRASVLVAIVGLHLLAVYTLSSGLAGKLMEAIAPPIQVEIIQEIQQRAEPPPPLPSPELQSPQIEVPRPEINIKIPVEVRTAIVNVAIVPTPTPRAISAAISAPVPRAPRRIVRANIGKNFPSPNDFYPPSSLRLREQGTAKVRVCVGPNGKLAEPPSVVKTSGVARLDEAAIKLARVGHYLAGSVDGVARTECLYLPVKFHLKS